MGLVFFGLLFSGLRCRGCRRGRHRGAGWSGRRGCVARGLGWCGGRGRCCRVGQSQHGGGRSDQGSGEFLHDGFLPLKMPHGAWSTSENALCLHFVDAQKIYFLASTPCLDFALSAFFALNHQRRLGRVLSPKRQKPPQASKPNARVPPCCLRLALNSSPILFSCETPYARV